MLLISFVFSNSFRDYFYYFLVFILIYLIFLFTFNVFFFIYISIISYLVYKFFNTLMLLVYFSHFGFLQLIIASIFAQKCFQPHLHINLTFFFILLMHSSHHFAMRYRLRYLYSLSYCIFLFCLIKLNGVKSILERIALSFVCLCIVY